MSNEPEVWSPLTSAIECTTLARVAGLSVPNPNNGILIYCSQAGILDYYRLDLNNTNAVDNFQYLSTTIPNAPNSRWVKTNMQGPSGGGGTLPQFKGPANWNVASTDGDFYVDTAGGGPTTATLPAVPVLWEKHQFVDYKDEFSGAALVINGNGNNIEQPGAPTVAPAVTLTLGTGGYGGNGVKVTLQWNGVTWTFFG